MQRYRPDIWWPGTNEKGFPEPEPGMAEDSATGQYYHKDDVDAVLNYVLPYLHVDIRDKVLQMMSGAVQPSCDAASK